MDCLPLVPKDKLHHDVSPLVVSLFQDCVQRKFPENVAENMCKSHVDPSKCRLEKICQIFQEGCNEADKSLEEITQVEREIMALHSNVLNLIDASTFPEESIKLKRHHFFEKLEKHSIEAYNLLEKLQILPSKVEQFLNFTYNDTLHTCNPCRESPRQIEATFTNGKPIHEYYRRELVRNRGANVVFVVEPPQILFKNYEIGGIYVQKFRLRNVSHHPESFSFFNLSTNSPFCLKMLSDSNRLAPGMAADFSITFKPRIYNNCDLRLTFKSRQGIDCVLNIYCTREAPRLSCFVFNSSSIMQGVNPNTHYFSNRRRSALNFTIDCGSCLIGNSNVVTLVMRNEGLKGKFFLTSEYEWMYTELTESGTRTLELKLGPFTIFPTYFEMDTGEVCELFVFFNPDKVELYAERICIICDNNSCTEVEIVGDSVTFQANFLKVDLYVAEDNFVYDSGANCLEVTVQALSTFTFILAVSNKSPVDIHYYWTIKLKPFNPLGKKIMDAAWISVLNCTKCLPSYSTTDFVVQVNANTEEPGRYYTFISLYLKDIPVQNIPAHRTDFIVDTKGSDCSCCSSGFCYAYNPPLEPEELGDFVDIHICELEVDCVITKPPLPQKSIQELKALELSQPAISTDVKPVQKLKFCQSVLNFGLLPKGVQVCKHVVIESVGEGEVEWRVLEIRWMRNMNFSIIRQSKSLSSHSGQFAKKGRKVKLTYMIDSSDDDQDRWISFLILFSSSPTTKDLLSIESVCLVTFEVRSIEIGIHSDTSDLPILSLKQLLYVNLPTVRTFHVHNAGVLTGCFYFLKPVGKDAPKARLRFQPHCGVIPPGICVQIKVEITPIEGGIFEDFYVPCFTGDMQDVITLKILCAVDGINLYFHLPHKDGGFCKILWPPRSDPSAGWNYFEVEAEDVKQDGGGSFTGMGGEDTDEQLKAVFEPQPSFFDESICDIVDTFNSVVVTYPTVKAEKVYTRAPKKVTFYVENITPMTGCFSVEANNYGPEESCVGNILVKAKVKSARDLWEKYCNESTYGIVVEAERPSGDLVGYEVVEINLWIYANTWGSYLEEIIVEVEDLTPFCFNLIVDVEGLPLEFPFAVNTIRDKPTMRLGSLIYGSASVTRSVKIVNVSAIPLQICWHTFDNGSSFEQNDKPFNVLMELFDSSRKVEAETLDVMLSWNYHGEEVIKYISVEPLDFILDKGCGTDVSVTICTEHFKSRSTFTNVRFNLVGYYRTVKTEDDYKENFFRRKSVGNVPPLEVAIMATLQPPSLIIESLTDTKFDFYVNDLIFKGIRDISLSFILKNRNHASLLFSLEIQPPFSFVQSRKDGTTNRNFRGEEFKLEKDQCMEVDVNCHLSYEDLLAFAELIYSDYQHLQCGTSHGHLIPSPNFISVISKQLSVCQKGYAPNVIPLEINLHYPQIDVKPASLDFNESLVYHSKKMFFSVYNLTGGDVKFEVLVESESEVDDFEANPKFGVILGSTGCNFQFTDVFIYFTPRACKLYTTTIRILTNMPNYYIDVPLRGYGTNDEKFLID